MRPLPDCTLIAAAELPERAADLRAEAWRLVTASSVRRPGGAFTVLYHFERGDRLVHLRVELPAGRAMPSIGSVYPGAFLVENEMVELHGVPIQGMAIDYGGRLYRDFDRLEGWVHGESDGGRPPSPLAVAARLRLDACVPLRVDGREVRAPGSRVPDAPAVGEDADAAEPSSRQPPDRERDDGAGA